MTEQGSGKKHGNRKLGRNKKKCEAYAHSGKRFLHKLKHILHSAGGLKEAEVYCKKNQLLTSQYTKLVAHRVEELARCNKKGLKHA